MKEMTVLMTGASGFIGSNLIKAISKIDGFGVICPSHKEMDITNIKQVRATLEGHRPCIVVNLAAHRNANSAEDQRGNKEASAWMSNVIGPQNIAEVTKSLAIPLIQISTDMVFGGYDDNKGPYSEDDSSEFDEHRLTWYGWTKRLGESAVLPDATVIRIGNVSQPIYHPNLDYIGKFLWLFDTGRQPFIFFDQQVTLTDISDLTHSILEIIRSGIHGIFHVASNDVVTPLELTEYLLRMARPAKKYKVESKSIDDYLKQFPNRYPKYGGLGSQLTQERLGLYFKNWRDMVDNFVKLVA